MVEQGKNSKKKQQDDAPAYEYEVRYDHTDMMVKLVSPSEPPAFLKENPQGDFIDALNYFCRRFYPMIDLDDNKDGEIVPWLQHKNATAREKWVNSLKDFSWPLAWYWKSLLSVAHEYKQEEQKNSSVNWYVSLSQIRQWNMVTVYSEENTEKGTQRTLLRPPLFGKSDHVLRKDSYWSLAMTKNQNNIAVAWDQIKNQRKEDLLSKEEYHDEKWYVIGRHDMIYKIEKVTFPDNKTLRIKLSSRLELRPFEIENFEKKQLPSIKSLKRPYDFVDVPIFQSHKEKDKEENKSAQILLSSDHMCQALEEASEIWNDNTTESVLLISPPGSGKEILAKTLYEFRRFYGKYVPSALVPGASEYNQKLLCFNAKKGQENRATPTKKELKKYVETGKAKRHRKPFKDYEEGDGLILRSRGGLLFLDEIDKVKKDDRAGLLRLLENKEFAFYAGTNVFSLKHSTPLFVFAGSKPKKEMFREEPSDFWTRISHIIEMRHPLEIDNEIERLRAYADYFVFFWQKHVPKFFIESEIKCVVEENGNKKDKNNEKFLANYYGGLYKVLMNNFVVYNIAKIFAKQGASGNTIVSLGVRHIRSIVSRSVFSIVEFLLYDKWTQSPLITVATDKSALGLFGDSWMELLIWLLSSQKLPKDGFLDEKEEWKTEEIKKIVKLREKLERLRSEAHLEIVSIVADAIRKVCIL